MPDETPTYLALGDIVQADSLLDPSHNDAIIVGLDLDGSRRVVANSLFRIVLAGVNRIDRWPDSRKYYLSGNYIPVYWGQNIDPPGP